MLTCEEISLDSLFISQETICPNVNVGWFEYENYRFLVQLLYTKVNELESLGVTFENINTCGMAKTYTCMSIIYLHDYNNEITPLIPKPKNEDSDDVVFRRKISDIKDIGCMNNINKWVFPLIGSEINDLQGIFDFILKIKQKISKPKPKLQ